MEQGTGEWERGIDQEGEGTGGTTEREREQGIGEWERAINREGEGTVNRGMGEGNRPRGRGNGRGEWNYKFDTCEVRGRKL
jgi:hypothetical protein